MHHFKLHWSYSISYFNLANLGKNLLWNHNYLSTSTAVSLEIESDNFCVVFTYSINRACEINKFHVVVVQRRQRNVQNSVMHFSSLLWKYLGQHTESLSNLCPSLASMANWPQETVSTFKINFLIKSQITNLDA